MSLTKQLQATSLTSASKFQKLNNLKVGQKYIINEFNHFATRYGPTLLASVEGEVLPVLLPIKYYLQFGGDKLDETNRILKTTKTSFIVEEINNNVAKIKFQDVEENKEEKPFEGEDEPPAKKRKRMPKKME